VSKNIRIRFLVVLPALAFLAFVVAVTDLGALAQNTNSSTPTENEAMQNENAEAAPARPSGRRRRGRRPPANDNMAADTNMASEAGAAAQDPDTGTRSPGEQSDLSGTYTGNVRMTGGHEMSGQGTLTITGNTFNLEAEGMTHTGRVIAITTRGYTGASFYFSDVTDPASNTPLAASVRARHSGSRLSLTPVPGARNRFWFNAGGGGRGRRRRGGAMNTNTNTNTDANMNMNTNGNTNTTP
jgi:hypothetical protein